MRADIKIQLVCSICDTTLEADDGKDKSRIQFNSADNMTAHIAVKPCEKCYEKATRPAKLIKEALRGMEEGSI